ncbi:uncharacterized protein LOC111297662 [Durio zibethinus]|uniref:Uncharacterized protein LOC111297662 n=1 Tax=Durio zibethinus TaxID=66656 RepID=A0A6P5Z6R2_DURZI|nr:uncharacterized protein LOC111297662 [Durio zibethinus]
MTHSCVMHVVQREIIFPVSVLPSNIMIHEKCISLPRIIKITRHHHYMIHNYFFQGKEHKKHDCGVYLCEVKAKYGRYNCLKQDCDFVAHVNCAMEMYVKIDQVNDQDEGSIQTLATNSSITCVIERNEHGEAMKVKHFNHEHDLTLGKMIKEDDVKGCDGCMLSISTCVELPRKTRLWFHQSLTTLINSSDIFKCYQCKRLCSGSLTKGKCNACGARLEDGAYKCKDKDCTFALHFARLTLPRVTWHTCDKHMLNLKFHDENHDPEQYDCDICEVKRDPNHWFYHCVICDNSAHPNVLLENIHLLG